MNLISFLIILLSIAPFLVMSKTKQYFHFAVLSLIAVLIHGIYTFGTNIIFFLIIVFAVSTVSELLSLKTSFNIFGVKYRYILSHPYFSSRITMLGVYPIEVAVTWVLLKYISFCVAYVVTVAFELNQYHFLILSSLILVSIDLIVDPVAVKVANMWKWDKGSRYFGIPYRNFLGWLIVGLATSIGFYMTNPELFVKIDLLFLLPIILYASILRSVKRIYKIDKTNAIVGSTPAIIWTILGFVSFLLYYF